MKINYKAFKDYHFLTFIFLTVSMLGILKHELWLDEAHHWLLAKDSISFKDLVHNTRYEGHPILWNLLLFGISRVTDNVLWMQILHILIGTVAVFTFLKYAPFSRLIKVLFIFGYFMFFEYTLLSRNYMLGVVFLFLACSVFNHRKERFIKLAVLLACTANTHAIFLILASSLMFVLILEYLQDNGLKFTKRFIIGLAIFTAGALLSVAQILPPSDTVFFDRVNEIPIIDRILRCSIVFFKALVPLPDFSTLSFWNSNLIINTSRIGAAIAGVISFLLPLFVLYKNKFSRLYFYTVLLGSLLFFYLTQIYVIRFHGMLYFAFFTALWIEHSLPKTNNRLTLSLPKFPYEKFKKTMIYGILTIHLFSGIVSFGMDYIHPFTNAQKVTQVLKETELSHKVIATKACDGTALSSYLKKPVFFLRMGKYQTSCNWGDISFNRPFEKKQVISALETLAISQNESFIYVSSDPVFMMKDSKNWSNLHEIKYRFLQKLEGSILKRGNYYIYEITRNDG